MIHIFKSNIFLNSLLLLVYTVVVRIHAIIYPSVTTADSTTNAVQEWIMTCISSDRAYAIVACLLVYFQGLMVNRLVIKNRIGHQLSLLPGMFYILGVSLLPQFVQFNLPLLSTTFVIIGITRLYGVYKEHNPAVLVFDVGLYFGLASIIEPAFAVFFILGYIGLIILRAVKTKDRIQYIAGILVPYFLWFSYTYWKTGESEVPTYLGQLIATRLPPIQIDQGFYVMLTSIVLSLVAVIGYKANTSKKAIQVQKKVDILYWSMLLSGFMLFNAHLSINVAIALMVPLSFFVAQQVLRLKGLFVAEVIHVVVLVLVVMYHFGFLTI